MLQNVIEVRGLKKRYDQVTAVDGIDLTVGRGECVGLLGPNGAGKTTTVEILEGLKEPSEGEVVILGMRWSEHPEKIRARIGIQLQETHFYERMSVAETIKLFRSFFPTGYTVEEAIAMVRLEEKRDTWVMNLSGGQKQRLALAVSLVGKPDILFLDEPTTGLDPQSRRAIWDVVDGLKRNGCSVLLTTHHMEEAEKLCDRIVIVDRGQVVVQGTPGELIATVGGEEVIELRSDPPFSREVLDAIPGMTTLREVAGMQQLSVRELHRALPAVLNRAEALGCSIQHLSTRRATLDDVFLGVTGRRLRETE